MRHRRSHSPQTDPGRLVTTEDAWARIDESVLEGRCGLGCTIGKRILRDNLLSGAILRFWPEIRASWTSESRRPKLVKLQDSAGNVVAGLRVTPSELEVLRVVLEDVRELASTEASVLSSMMSWLQM